MEIVKRGGEEAPEGCTHLFWNSAGRPVTNSNAHVALRKAVGEEFEWVISHVFRKTVATRLAPVVGVGGVAKQLGHTERVAEELYIQRDDFSDMAGVWMIWGCFSRTLLVLLSVDLGLYEMIRDDVVCHKKEPTSPKYQGSRLIVVEKST